MKASTKGGYFHIKDTFHAGEGPMRDANWLNVVARILNYMTVKGGTLERDYSGRTWVLTCGTGEMGPWYVGGKAKWTVADVTGTPTTFIKMPLDGATAPSYVSAMPTLGSDDWKYAEYYDTTEPAAVHIIRD